MPGVISTRVGYTGGTTLNPTYYSLGDHSESIEITFDPSAISYRELLHVFWSNHNPALRSSSQQYRAFVFYHDETQKAVAEETRDAVAAELKTEVRTEIVPAGTFYQAEDYHQKYYLTYLPAVKQVLQARYPRYADFITSTAVARLNGYSGGYITAESLVRDLAALGWEQPDIARVLDAAGEDVTALCPVPE